MVGKKVAFSGKNWQKGRDFLMFKITHGLLGVSKEVFFKEPTVCHTRGHRLKVDFPMAMTRARRNHLSYRAVDSWNKLPSWVVEADSVNGFKHNIDKHWIKMKYLSPQSPH